ncbi:MAG: virulence RhuM family protein [Deltaproteobacteria bacterium]|nr:virulence RhuM family protein [Deltaproteobacteria bacterium]
MNKRDIVKQQSDFILYTSNEGKVNIEVYLQDETIWLTQKAISELYGVQRPAITKHLKNIFDSGELQEDSVSSILEHTASDGKNYKTKFYNLTQFHIWATKTLKEYIIKCFVLDDERLKQGNQVFARDFFDRISTNSTQIHTLEKLRDTLLPKLMSGKVKVQFD